MKEIKNSAIVENIFFRFVSYNIPNLQSYSKLIKFKLSTLLTGSLMKSVLYTKSHSKEFHEYRTKIGIRTNEISVMWVGSKLKHKYYLGFFRVFID